jgi:hypothetical protein
MKTMISSQKWRKLILVAFLVGGMFNVLNITLTQTKANEPADFCPAPAECRTACYTGTAGSRLCSSSCGLYSCVE